MNKTLQRGDLPRPTSVTLEHSPVGDHIVNAGQVEEGGRAGGQGNTEYTSGGPNNITEHCHTPALLRGRREVDHREVTQVDLGQLDGPPDMSRGKRSM